MEERCLAPRYMTSHAVIKMEGVQAWALIRYGHTDEIPPLGVYGSKGGRYMTSHAVTKWKEYRRGLEDALIRYGHTDEIPPLGVYGSKGGTASETLMAHTRCQ